jgi:uncharacterized protein (DUF849 family)
MFSQTIAFGFPPTSWALESYLKLLVQEHAGAPWMIAGLGVELEGLIEEAVELGGHVRVGLEDSPMGCPHHNLQLVRQARQRIEAAGGRLAEAQQVRARLHTPLPQIS